MRKNSKSRPAPRDCNVYVIRLNPAVLTSRKFRENNPDHNPSKPCVYVGMTFRTPDERFEQHKRPYKACRLVYKYGERLSPKHYERLNPMTRAEAEKQEVALAQRLRRRGYAVWQN